MGFREDPLAYFAVIHQFCCGIFPAVTMSNLVIRLVIFMLEGGGLMRRWHDGTGASGSTACSAQSFVVASGLQSGGAFLSGVDFQSRIDKATVC